MRLISVFLAFPLTWMVATAGEATAATLDPAVDFTRTISDEEILAFTPAHIRDNVPPGCRIKSLKFERGTTIAFGHVYVRMTFLFTCSDGQSRNAVFDFSFAKAEDTMDGTCTISSSTVLSTEDRNEMYAMMWAYRVLQDDANGWDSFQSRVGQLFVQIGGTLTLNYATGTLDIRTCAAWADQFLAMMKNIQKQITAAKAKLALAQGSSCFYQAGQAVTLGFGLLGSYHTSKLSAITARASCEGRGYRLATIHELRANPPSHIPGCIVSSTGVPDVSDRVYAIGAGGALGTVVVSSAECEALCVGACPAAPVPVQQVLAPAIAVDVAE